MRKLVLFALLVACICAYPGKRSFNLKFDKIEVKKNYPDIRTEVRNYLQGRDLTDCTLSAFYNQDLCNLCSDEIFGEVDYYTAGNYEPLGLPDYSAGFSYDIIITTFHGEVVLTNGKLYEISSLHRDGNVEVALDGGTTSVALSLPVAFNTLHLTYDYSASIMDLGPSGGIDGHADNIELGFAFAYHGDVNQISLDQFSINRAGDISFSFSGSSLVDWLLDLLADAVTTLLKSAVIDVMENIVRNALQGAVDSINQDLANGGALDAAQFQELVTKTLKERKLM